MARYLIQRDTHKIEFLTSSFLIGGRFGVPAAAWEYKLGIRSGLEWVLERYRERTPKDKTVAERFHTYRFADHKEAVVTLLGRVCRVSVETAEITDEMVAETEPSTLTP